MRSSLITLIPFLLSATLATAAAKPAGASAYQVTGDLAAEVANLITAAVQDGSASVKDVSNVVDADKISKDASKLNKRQFETVNLALIIVV